MHTADYLDRTPRELSQVMAARERREAYREFRDGPHRNAMEAVRTVRIEADSLPEGASKEMILAMLTDIESEFRGELNRLHDMARV